MPDYRKPRSSKPPSRDDRGSSWGGKSEKKSYSKPFAKKSFGGGFEGRSSGKPSMHKAICAECNITCEIPFKPSGTKAIFCKNCFRREDAAPARAYGRPQTSELGNKEQFAKLNSKLDKILKALNA
jgi:CxxC-x17-CxxC domain-containing protein